MYNSSVCANVFNIKNRITIKFINSIIHIAKVIKFLPLAYKSSRGHCVPTSSKNRRIYQFLNYMITRR